MHSSVDQIKQKLDIVDVVGSYIKLQKVGANYRAPSPFNSETNPSFYVSPAKQIWHDFSSGKGGDMFSFVMEVENIEFTEALKILAKKAGVTLDISPQEKKQRSVKDRQYELNDIASSVFEKQIFYSTPGKKALQYLLDRGLTMETIQKWRIGYAPDSWDFLYKFLSKKYTGNEIEKAGLAIRNNKGGFYDRFRERIMFPIFSPTNKISGFTGRILTKAQEEKGMSKYMNVPNTLVYDKSIALYGLNFAKMGVVKKGEIIIVEGQMDVLMSHQAGVTNVIASSGTALTEKHLETLKKFTKNLILAFDMDLGGNSAMDRAIKLAIANGFNVSTITMSKGKDPADIVQESPDEWIKMAQEKKSIVDFYFEVASSRYDADTVEGKKEISNMVLPVIKILSSKIEQNYWLEKLSGKIRTPVNVLTDEMANIEGYAMPVIKEEVKKVVQKPQTVKSRKDMLEERILSLALYDSKLKISKEIAEMFGGDFADIANQESLTIEQIEDSTKKDYLNRLIFQREIEGQTDIDPKQDFDESIKEFKAISIKNKMAELQLQIKDAEMSKAAEKTARLCSEFKKLNEELTKL